MACAADTCQHTCEPSAIEKCAHAWTLRYTVNGEQVEKSFRDKVHETTGRTLYGSGKKLAQDFQLKLTVDKRSADVTLADHGERARRTSVKPPRLTCRIGSQGCQMPDGAVPLVVKLQTGPVAVRFAIVFDTICQ